MHDTPALRRMVMAHELQRALFASAMAPSGPIARVATAVSAPPPQRRLRPLAVIMLVALAVALAVTC